MKGRLARFILLATSVCAIMVATVFAMGWYYYDTKGPLNVETTVVIKRGTAFKASVNLLYRNRIINQPTLFALTALATQKSSQFKAGEYRFQPGASFRAVLHKLVSGDTVIRRLTIPEGYTVSQILVVINHTEGLEGTVTLPVKEGELLPETYHFSYGEQRNDIVLRMQRAMQRTIATLWDKRQPDLPFTSPQAALVLASIVEKETGIAAERPRIAAVFLNRLKRGMPLQSDPTVMYAITKGQGVLDRALNYNDLKFLSPYNTYIVQGLPPHPIANPGKAAIIAVLHPLTSKELYFVADGKGGHNFAQTLEEHNRNVAAFRRHKE